MIQITGIIPARYASTRFPGKPLVLINGKTMIQRVYEQSKKSKFLEKVVVATDDERIFNHVVSFGGVAIMTGLHHQSGTERCSEVAEKIISDAYINIQGDEPYIHPEQIDEVALLLQKGEVHIATLIKKITDAEELFNTNKPKVVISNTNKALYFSRQAIPFLRGIESSEWLSRHDFYKHIGIYGYKRNTLLEIVKLPLSALEKSEALEQLRWLENGFDIHTGITELESYSVDTEDDLKSLPKT
ncbi:MAG: 3-deoxy-manno-octulosonate cytidylyltransferase [Bacteroidia bacterium]